MPSALLPNHNCQNIQLPPLAPLETSMLETRKGSTINRYFHNDSQPPCGPAEIQYGLRTPPGDMNGASVNPLLAPNYGGYQYKSVPAVTANGGPYRPTVGSTANTRYVNKPNLSHNHHHQKIYSQEHVSVDPEVTREIAARGHSAVDGASIVSYLQIPSSINESKGSLAEFAAQITCLFWFETSFTLHYVEESKTTPLPIQPLVPEAVPTMGFRKWVVSILSTTQVSQNVILLALMFIYRLKKLNPGVKGKLGSEFRLFTVALMLGNKFLDDNTYTNKTWAEVSGISVQEIHIMEVEFLSNMRYTLYASDLEWKAWHVKLAKFWKYFDTALKTPTEAPPRVLNPPVTTSIGLPNLPSPPASTHTSPPYMASHSFNNSNNNHNNTPTHPHPLSVPPYMPLTGPSSFVPLPEPSQKPAPRKRSHDQTLENDEPPAKRQAPSTISSAASSSTLTPSSLNGFTPGTSFTTPSTGQMSSTGGMRLPMPNLSISTGHQSSGLQGPILPQLPLPSGAAKPASLPSVSRLPQGGFLPPLPQSLRLHHDANHASSPTTDWSSRRSSCATSAETPSPTTIHFPQSAHTPTHLSPGAYPFPRNSPYKPVRNVHTLLVPPPSGSMHNPQRDISNGQMHYQPLGKPASQSRPGVLPFLQHDSWGQPQDRPIYLPQPNSAS
ncbi:MAG: hypothetical protein Q9222_007033 [Ikaeria aurantiellina]